MRWPRSKEWGHERPARGVRRDRRGRPGVRRPGPGDRASRPGAAAPQRSDRWSCRGSSCGRGGRRAAVVTDDDDIPQPIGPGRQSDDRRRPNARPLPPLGSRRSPFVPPPPASCNWTTTPMATRWIGTTRGMRLSPRATSCRWPRVSDSGGSSWQFPARREAPTRSGRSRHRLRRRGRWRWRSPGRIVRSGSTTTHPERRLPRVGDEPANPRDRGPGRPALWHAGRVRAPGGGARLAGRPGHVVRLPPRNDAPRAL